MRHIFLDARSELSPTQYDYFISWADAQLISQVSDYYKTPIGFDDLGGVYDAETISLEKEFLWLSARIKSLKLRVNAYLELKELMELAVMTGNYQSGIDVLQKIDLVCGCSLWSIQNRIALEHQAGGLERQKNYVSEVRSVYKTGLLNFVAYYTSARNEDKTTPGKFVDDILNRIDRHSKYTDSIKTYLKNILTNSWPHDEAKYSDILRVSQSHSVVDFYEAFIAVIQQLIRTQKIQGPHATLTRCLQDLGEHVGDVRLEKSLYHLDGGKNWRQFSLRSTETSDEIFSDAPIFAKQSLLEGASINLLDPWTWIYHGFSCAISGGEHRVSLKQPADVSEILGRVLSRRDQNEDSFAQIGKLTLNFSGLRVFAGLADFLPIIRVRDFDEILKPHLVGLNSPNFGIEDFPRHATGWPTNSDIFSAFPATKTSRAWELFIDPSGTINEPQSVSEEIMFAAGLLNERSYAKASGVVQTLIDRGVASPVHSLLVALHIRALKKFGARQRLIELIADEGARGLQSVSLLPINEAFENFQWEDFSDCSVPLSAPVALHLWLTLRENEEALSWLRFATGRFLKMSGFSHPSQLVDSAEPYLRHQLKYFLRNICIPSILDVSRVLKGTRRILEERQAICATLREIDAENKAEYEQEITLIGNELVLQEGLSIVDQSRIHVDANALKRWAVKEIAEDFERYIDLLKVDLKATKDFDEIVKEIVDGSLPRSAFVPENEADALLYSMLLRLTQEFLMNPTFGFDFYLSKRIRHQSFIGLIRGPIEFSNLITTRESEGSAYRDNNYWMSVFSDLDAVQVVEINSILLRFGAKFDETLLNAKNNLFHVRSNEKPAGLMGVEISSQHVALVKTLVDSEERVVDFVDTALAMLWASLEGSLKSVRMHISEEIQVKIASYFDELKAGVRKIADNDYKLIEFNLAVGQSSADVQRALEDASRWFSRTSFEAQMRLFSLDQAVKVGVDSALKAQRSFDPLIETVVEGAISLRATALVFLHDVFFVALDNIRCHSGLKHPWIKVKVWIDGDDDELHVEVRNQTRGANRLSSEKNMNEIRNAIQSKAMGQSARREGFSGFIKIATVINQSSKGKIDFGYASDEEFILSVVYSLVVTVEAVGNAD